MTSVKMAQFIPRQVFPHYGAIPRSYFLGHHRAGLSKMKTMLSTIDYVVECRDYRAPVTSINPIFEEALENKRRLIVYTKRDLGSVPNSPAQKQVSLAPNRPWPMELQAKKWVVRSRKKYGALIGKAQCSSSAHLLALMSHPSSDTFEMMPKAQISWLGAGC